jgi:hypothetical protein
MGTYQKKRLSGILGLTFASVAVLAVANAADMYPGTTPTGGVVDWAGFYIGGARGELSTPQKWASTISSAASTNP